MRRSIQAYPHKGVGTLNVADAVIPGVQQDALGMLKG